MPKILSQVLGVPGLFRAPHNCQSTYYAERKATSAFLMIAMARRSFILPALTFLCTKSSRYSTLYSVSPTTALIPTFDEIRSRLQPVWEKEENRSMIMWAGIFGSVGRGRAQQHSDVDIVLVMKKGVSGEPVELEEGEKKHLHYADSSPQTIISLFSDLKGACARDVSYIPIWRHPDGETWMWGHVRVEALLSGRTVYGDREDVKDMRQEGIDVLERAKERYDSIAEAVGSIKSCVSRAQTVEVSLCGTIYVISIDAYACADLRRCAVILRS